MAKINSIQLEELISEAKFQLQRLRKELVYPKKPPGLLKSKKRFELLLSVLMKLQRDGFVELVDDELNGEEGE